MQRLALTNAIVAAAASLSGAARRLSPTAVFPTKAAAAIVLPAFRSLSSCTLQQSALPQWQRQQLGQRRWCSTSHGRSTAPADSTAVSAPPPSPSSKVDGTPSSTTCSAEVEAQIQEWEKRLSGLSQADRELIIDALLHPEKQKPSVMGGAGIGPKDADMVAAFTCGKCDFRMVKKFSKHAYTKGIVIVECPNCRVKHLLADNLGWLENEAMNIEDFLREKGESFTRVGSGDYQVLDDDAAMTKGNHTVTNAKPVE